MAVQSQSQLDCRTICALSGCMREGSAPDRGAPAQARSCRLFEGVQTKCMDALLNASKVELFMPKVPPALRSLCTPTLS